MPVIINEVDIVVQPPSAPTAPTPQAGEAAREPATPLPDAEQVSDMTDFLAQRFYRLWAH